MLGRPVSPRCSRKVLAPCSGSRAHRVRNGRRGEATASAGRSRCGVRSWRRARYALCRADRRRGHVRRATARRSATRARRLRAHRHIRPARNDPVGWSFACGRRGQNGRLDHHERRCAGHASRGRRGQGGRRGMRVARETTGHRDRRPRVVARRRGGGQAAAWTHPTRQEAAQGPPHNGSILRRLAARMRHNSNIAYSLSPSAAPDEFTQTPHRPSQARQSPAYGSPLCDQRPCDDPWRRPN